MKVLAVGAAGRNAGLVVPALLARGAVVRALVRDARKSGFVASQGAQEVVVADLTDPTGLREAVEGVDGVFHINPAFAEDEAGLGVRVVEAAAAAGVGRFVFSSVYHPSISLTNHAGKRAVEEAVYNSGMQFSVLQPAIFMQTLDPMLQGARDSGRITQPWSVRAPACYVDYRDVAEVAAQAMTGDDLVGGTFELSAPGQFDRTHLADILTEVLGRPVEAAAADPADTVRDMPAGPVREGLLRMFADYDAHGFPGGSSIVLQAVLGRSPTTVQEYLRQRAEQPAADSDSTPPES